MSKYLRSWQCQTENDISAYSTDFIWNLNLNCLLVFFSIFFIVMRKISLITLYICWNWSVAISSFISIFIYTLDMNATNRQTPVSTWIENNFTIVTQSTFYIGKKRILEALFSTWFCESNRMQLQWNFYSSQLFILSFRFFVLGYRKWLLRIEEGSYNFIRIGKMFTSGIYRNLLVLSSLLLTRWLAHSRNWVFLFPSVDLTDSRTSYV